MIDVTFLGTSGSAPTRDRDNTAFLLRTGSGAVLVDCPGAVVPKILRAGARPQDLAAIFITHTHPDHLYGLPAYFHGLMLREHVVRVFGSRETVEFCARLLDVFGLRAPRFRTRAEFVPLEDGETRPIVPGLEVAAFRVPHLASSLACEFRLRDGGPRVVFSGDTPGDPGLFRRTEGADLVCHDCAAPERFFAEYPALAGMHTSARALGRMAAEAGVRRLAPCHFLVGDLEFDLAEIEAEIRSLYGGPLVIPADMERITL